MQTRSRPLISLFRAIVLAAITALFITSATLPMAAQNSVPPSAFQAARMPEFAKRLAHPVTSAEACQVCGFCTLLSQSTLAAG